MTALRIGTRQEWLAARTTLLEAEKELTRNSDALTQQRQELPWVPIDRAYRFDADEGTASLEDLFKGRSQLLIYRFMYGPDYHAGCPSCSMVTDGFNGFTVHLARHYVMLWAVSRTPLAKLKAYKQRMGWTFPWASSHPSDFNADSDGFFTEDQQRGGIDYNYRCEPTIEWRTGEVGGGGSAEAKFAAMRNRHGHRPSRHAGCQRIRARERCHLSHLFHLCTRRRRDLGHVPVARPRAQRTQRDGWRLVAPAR